MTNKKWYHYGMLNVWAQLGITMGCSLTVMFAIIVYEGLEEDIVHFEGECGIESALDDDGNTTVGLIATCGEDHRVGLSTNQERMVYFHELTTGERPAIMCRYTISEYLEDERWRCTVETGEEETT